MQKVPFVDGYSGNLCLGATAYIDDSAHLFTKT